MAAFSIVGPKIPNLSQNFVHFSKKSSITRLFETFCTDTPSPHMTEQSYWMELSRDVERASLSCTVLPLEVVKI